MLSDNLCSAELFTLECIRGLFNSALERMEEGHDDSLLSIADIIEAVKFQSEVYIHGALEDGLRKLV